MSAVASMTPEESARHKEATKAKERYPDRLPLVLERGSKNIPALGKSGWMLVPADLSIAKLAKLVRRRLTDVPPTAEVRLEVVQRNGKAVPVDDGAVADCYSRFHNTVDRFLHLRYTVK